MRSLSVAIVLSAKHNCDMHRIAQALGRRGGLARARRLSVAERSAIAALGGRARSLSHHAARRINENASYLMVMETLRGRKAPVVKLHRFHDPLPCPHGPRR